MKIVNSLLIAGLALGAVTAQAQTPRPAAPRTSAQKPAAATPTPPSPPPPVSAEPQSTSATFGDWVLRCDHPAGAARICEVVQSITVQGQGTVAQLAFGQPTAADPLRLTVLLPPNITIATRPKVMADAQDSQGMELTWLRCVSGGCMADVTLSDDDLRRLRTRELPGRITFKDAANHDVTIPLSWRGLPQAMDALAKA